MPADMNNYFNNKNSNNNNSNNNGGDFQPPDFIKNFGKKAGLLYVIVIIIAFIVMTKPYTIVSSGEVGIKVTAGKFDQIALEPGFHFFIPVIQKIILVDTRVRVLNYKRLEDLGSFGYNQGIVNNDAITVLDSRGLTVSIELTVQYRIKPLGAPQTIATWGLSWEEKIINPVVRDMVRSVVGRFTAEELPTKRNEIANLIESEIRRKMDKLDNQPVYLESVQLREIVLPQKIKEQIERVQIARQEAERAKYEVEQAKQQAEKKAALAQGNADAIKIESQGRADAIEIEAAAQAKANNLISKSLTDDVLRLKHLDIQNNFNEALRVNRDAKIFLTPGGSTPNIWVDTKDTKRDTAISQ
jgi:regulator of protease activity HflC (stomatin/prohibitin superfamily)